MSKQGDFKNIYCRIRLLSLIFALFAPIIIYFIRQDTSYGSCICHKFDYYIEEWPLLFTNDQNTWIHKFGAKRCWIMFEFIVQIIVETLPMMVIQLAALMYQSNVDIDPTTVDISYCYCLIQLLCVSISVAVISSIFKVLILIYPSFITTKWFVFNYLCIICDILGFIVGIVWIFCDNDKLFYMSSLFTFKSILQNLPIYQVVWFYSTFISLAALILSTIPVFLTSIVCYCCYILTLTGWSDERGIYFAVLMFAAVGFAIITVLVYLFAYVFCWYWFGCFFCLANKFPHNTIYDAALLNHFLHDSFIIQKCKHPPRARKRSSKTSC